MKIYFRQLVSILLLSLASQLFAEDCQEISVANNLHDENIITEGGTSYPVNIALVKLQSGEPRSSAEDLAKLVNGKIINYVHTANLYTFEVPTKTAFELDNILKLLNNDPRTDSAIKNYYLNELND